MLGSLRLLLVVAVLASATSATAATFTVDITADDAAKSTCDDATPNDCSLRGAVAAANANADHDTIVIPAGTYTVGTGTSACFFGAGTGDSENGTVVRALCVNTNVDIQGAGADDTILQSSGQDRFFAVGKQATVGFTGLSFVGGRATPGFGYAIGGGGAILNHGTVTIAGCVLTDNQANFGGGAIDNVGTLTIRSSTIFGNSTPAVGGAIDNTCCGGPHTLTVADSTLSQNGGHVGGAIGSNGIVTITGSTIDHNVGNVGGGISNGGGHLTVVNSTISGNTGQGIDNGRSSPEGASMLHLDGVTITGNSAYDGGGFYITGSQPVTIRNSIIAGNNASFAPDCGGTITSEGYNLIQSTQHCVINGDTATNVTGVDPRIAPLADNGGPTRTHALLPAIDGNPASPAIDAGSPDDPGSGTGSACSVVDQRGVLRPIGVRCDIGAFERGGSLAITKLSPNQAGNAGPLTVVVTGSGFEQGATVKLTRTGEADISGSPVHVESAGASLATTFDLTGRALGTWDVSVTDPGGTPATLAAALTIEPTDQPQLWADVIGRTAIRAGAPARFTVLYANLGNVDAVGVPLALSVPKDFVFDALFQVAAPPASAGQVIDDFSTVPIVAGVAPTSDLINIPLYLPVVPAGFIGSIDFVLTLPGDVAHGSEFLVAAKIEPEPWLTSNATLDARVADLVATARAYAARALGTPIPPMAEAAGAAYARTQLEAIAAAGRDNLVARLGQTGPVYSLTELTIDVAAFMADQATSRSRFGTTFDTLLALAARGDVATAEAGTCRCICGKVMDDGCTCSQKDCEKPFSPPNKPPNPAGIPPADCNEIPNHKVSDDGKQCVPKNTNGCARFQNIFFTDPDCVRIPILQAVDPNDKTPSTGSGPSHVVTGTEPLKYAVSFENEPDANAPAQVVQVTDHLDTTSLDLATFSFGPIAIGADVTILPPEGVTDFTGGADLRPKNDILVTVDAHLDVQTGVVTWTFTSLDPTTGQLTDDPAAGFLPPNTNPPDGEGRVVYTVSAKSNVATGTVIKNKASIVFDVNAPIDTPEVSNTIDKTAPVSAVTSAAVEDACDTSIDVDWSGTDDGSIVADYSVYVSVNGGPLTIWQQNTTDTSATYQGAPPNTYAFYSVARDIVGNTEAAPVAADVSRTLAACGNENDLAVTKLKAPKTVKLTAKKPTKAGTVAVEIQNRSRHDEIIPDNATLAALVDVTLDSTGACADPVATFHAPKKPKVITLKPAKRLKVTFDVIFTCANDAGKGTGHTDYSVQATVSHAPLGGIDAHPTDDACPRDVTPPSVVDPFPVKPIVDKGCGPKKSDKTLGGTLLIDVVGP